MSNKNNTSVTFDEWLKHQEKEGNIQRGPYTGPAIETKKKKKKGK
tara:strand:- start:312 stop:446 length:135 start_codon:yes stop_codon:yes gene_type:complete